jgi:cytochrome c-type biogenesis protein
MNIDQISYSLAFLAGIASFLSPCVLALVPAYIGFLGSQSAMHQREGFNKHERLDTIVSGVFFVLGFSFIFILLGAATSVLGSILYNVK